MSVLFGQEKSGGRVMLKSEQQTLLYGTDDMCFGGGSKQDLQFIE